MQHMIYHMDERDGRMELVLANGSMSAGGQEGKIREAIVRDDLVDCMIAAFKEISDPSTGTTIFLMEIELPLRFTI